MTTRPNTYTVKQLSDLAGVSIRTLHYYDEIGLLKPDAYGENGYRYYGEAGLLHLQQILFFRELDFSLADIQAILNRPGFDLLQALQVHRDTLRGRAARLKRLIHTIDQTIHHLQGEVEMNDSDYFAGFDEEKQKEHEAYIRAQYGDEPLNTSVKRWNAMTPAEKQEYGRRGSQLHEAIVANMAKGFDSPEIQALIAQYRAHLSFFYDVTLDIYEGLGHGYNQSPEFQAFYEAIHPGLAAFMEQAITYYVAQERKHQS